MSASILSSLRFGSVRSLAFARGLASASPASLVKGVPAALHLKSGQSFYGTSFGSKKSVWGETVFSTSITSYTESMTDPSYLGQILVFTTPLIGNYGVPDNTPLPEFPGIPQMESDGVKCAGVIVTDVALKHSHYLAVESLHEWCDRHNVPGISGIDTRAVTTILRNQGTTLGRIAVGEEEVAKEAPKAEEYWDPAGENLIAQVSTKEPYVLNPDGDVHIAVLDLGTKANILRSLVKRNAKVTVLPWNYDFNSVRDEFDGFFLTNGPGDPKSIMDVALNVRKTLDEWKKPIFGICMGHQILGLAAGMEAYRMTFGNRGHNQPVLALASSGSIKAGRVYVTSQNHQYALKLTEEFPEDYAPFFINCNDSSVEGIISTPESGKQVWGCQFHPESAGGPLDTIEMFTDFLKACRGGKDGSATLTAEGNNVLGEVQKVVEVSA
ncbi:carbamoyl-phosphate synthase [Phaffia rhodozyma]|uniref:Carbamoyl phosphate synthase arginine-specific small chain n=1 Tax=Phaffia rhodozyma TaxID=264483 RepID=A0A0F7SLF5_PHARH|nr:carbamoyl-phosphate synthase [Phaffia rhodozyma]